MFRLAALATALALATPSAAQVLPGPGEGVYTWERVGDLPLSTRALAFAPSGTIHSGGGLGPTLEKHHILTGPLPGVWQPVDDNDIGTTEIVALLALGEGPAGDTLVAGDINFLLRSVDGGSHWDDVTGRPSSGLRGGPRHPSAYLELPAGHAHAGRLLSGTPAYSDDRGGSWIGADESAMPDDGFVPFDFAVLPSGRLLGAGRWGIATSDDGGESWQPTEVFGAYTRLHGGVAPLATPGSAQAGGTGSGGAISIGYQTDLPGGARVYRTSDDGETWSAGLALPELVDGVRWSHVAGVIPLALRPDGLGRALVVMGRGFVYATPDGGVTWEVVGRLPVIDSSVWVPVAVLGPDGHLWVGVQRNGSTNEWLYRSAEPAESGVVVHSEGAPEWETIGVEVTPNPSAGGTVLVELTGDGAARATVMDARGRTVAELWAGELRGERTVELDTSAWATGVYTVVVEAEGERRAETFTVVR